MDAPPMPPSGLIIASWYLLTKLRTCSIFRLTSVSGQHWGNQLVNNFSLQSLRLDGLFITRQPFFLHFQEGMLYIRTPCRTADPYA